MGNTLIYDALTGAYSIVDTHDAPEEVHVTDRKTEIIAEINTATTNEQLRAAMIKLAELI